MKGVKTAEPRTTAATLHLKTLSKQLPKEPSPMTFLETAAPILARSMRTCPATGGPRMIDQKTRKPKPATQPHIMQKQGQRRKRPSRTAEIQ